MGCSLSGACYILMSMDQTTLAWVGFSLFILVMLGIDLGLFNRQAKVTTGRNTAIWSAVWVSLALIFAVGIFWRLDNWNFGGEALGWQFLTGYLIELSLSVDNLFVFLLVFSYFQVPPKYQHRVLFWGVLGALVMRAIMIFLGTALINRFHWIIYIFGAFLVFTGIRMFRSGETEIHPEQNPVVRLVKRFFPILDRYEGDKFFTRVDGRLTGTLLLLVLIIVEVTDLVFAVDSIPAIFGVTTDPFIVYTSNVFAILGLRTFYFLLAGVVEKFHYLRYGLAIVLTFIGTKMLIEAIHIKIPTLLSLAVVTVVLAASVIASLIWVRPAGASRREIDVPPDLDPSLEHADNSAQAIPENVERR